VKLSILVVEDARDSRELLRLFLTRRGYRVIMGSTGMEALYLAALQHPDLIITDIGLPDMNGIDLIAKLRRLNNGHPNVPIVAVTGYGDEAARDALSAGACRALIKPLDLDSLLDAVNNLMGTDQSGARHAGRESQGIRP